jgi:ribonuclease PH
VRAMKERMAAAEARITENSAQLDEADAAVDAAKETVEVVMQKEQALLVEVHETGEAVKVSEERLQDIQVYCFCIF